jgi:hypothetical protein
MMEKSSITMLIGAFVALIVGVSLIGVVATEGNEITNTITITDETVDFTSAVLASGVINTTYEFTIANAPTGWRITGCPITSFVLGNSSEDYTVVDYTFTASSGVIVFNNSDNINASVLTTNETLVDYVYCDKEYLTQSWNRTIINLVPGFFALALMGIGIGLFYGVMKREGIFNA